VRCAHENLSRPAVVHGAVVCSLSLLVRWAQRARCQVDTPLGILCKIVGPKLWTLYGADDSDYKATPFPIRNFLTKKSLTPRKRHQALCPEPQLGGSMKLRRVFPMAPAMQSKVGFRESVPADEIGAAYWRNGDFGTSPFLGSALDKLLLVCVYQCRVSNARTIGGEKEATAYSCPARRNANQVLHTRRFRHESSIRMTRRCKVARAPGGAALHRYPEWSGGEIRVTLP
jgi:hypothetical protein